MEAPISRGFYRGLEPLAEVLEANVEPEGVDPFGRIRSGTLKLRGPMLRDVCFKHDWKHPTSTSDGISTASRIIALRSGSLVLRRSTRSSSSGRDAQPG